MLVRSFIFFSAILLASVFITGCGSIPGSQPDSYCTQIAGVVQSVAQIACQALSSSEDEPALAKSGNIFLQTAVIQNDTVHFTSENYRDGYVRISWTSSQGKRGTLTMNVSALHAPL